MQRRTSLPVVLSTVFLWTLSNSLGCGGNAATTGAGGGGAGAGGSGASETGGNDTGGTSSGGAGGGDTGGHSSGGTGGIGTGGSGGQPPGCEVHTSQVSGCLQTAKGSEPPELPFMLQTTGVVTAVRPPEPGELCGSNYWYQVGFIAPQVMIDLSPADGAPLTIGLTVPGFAANAIAKGDMLVVKYSADMVGFGGRVSQLEIERDGALVAAVGENAPAGVTPSEGASECYQEDSLCGREYFTMDIKAPDGSAVSIANGETASVGDLTVTNDRYLHNYDISGGCNFGASVEYLMSAAATPTTP